MKILLLLGFLLGAGTPLLAQLPRLPAAPLRSVSGQFVIHDQRGLPTANTSSLLKKPAAAQLELAPSFLVVSCERIKQALYAELGAERQWRSAINVTLQPVRSHHDVAQIQVERAGSSWTYRVALPEKMERTQFFRTLVHVLLLEMANRTSGERSAEIPLWLSEGLTQRLLASREVELILSAPTMAIGSMMVTPTMIQTRDPDPLEAARRVLRDRPTPTIEELSWPEPARFTPEQAEVYQRSAQLFVAELLRLKDGQKNLHTFVTSLAQVYNWQTGFLRAFPEEFANQLALEKWWALQSSYFVGRDHQQLWTMAESAQKLDALLHAAIAIRATAGELPARTEVSLQVVIREWDTPRQITTLQGKLQELAQARRRVAPPFITLVNDYATALDDYLKNRKRSTATFGAFFTLPPSIQKVALEAVRQLDLLDARRAQISTWENLSPPAPAGPGAAPK